MSEGDRRPSLKEFDARLRAARQHGTDGGNSDRPGSAKATTGIGFAFRIGTELVAALVVGVGIGLLLDYWLDTKPWFLIVFFLLGAAAGFLNVFRAVSGYGLAAGYTKPGSPRDETKDEQG